jgi:predicted TIM-barrel fold metal-dependent hydrolase
MSESRLIVEAHHHAGDLSDSLSYDGRDASPEPPVEEDAKRRVARMDALGIAWAVIQPSHGYLRTDGLAATQRVNDRMAQLQAGAPDRIKAVGTTEPLHGADGVGEVDRVADIGLKGLAWHHRFQGCYIDCRWMWPTLERMQERGLVPMLHTNAESSLEANWRLQRLALDFPELTFIAMDALWTYERARHVLMTAEITPNVIWDLGGPVSYIGYEEWVKRNGSKTLCFSAGGTYSAGGPVTVPPMVGEIENAAISDADKANILGLNVAGAFGG